MTVEEYITARVAVLDQLIATQEPGSEHAYALLAGKFELLNVLMCVTQQVVSNSEIDDILGIN